MTQTEIKTKIEKLKKAIEANKNSKNYSLPDEKQLQEGLKKLEDKLKPKTVTERRLLSVVEVSPSEKKPEPKKKIVIRKEKSKTEVKVKAKVEKKPTLKKKVIVKPKAKTDLQKKIVIKKLPSKQTKIIDDLKKDIKKEFSPKDITITKGAKTETHKTKFDKDIEGAIVVLNKERFVIKEVKDRKTKKVKKVHHTPEYNNASIIQKRVNLIFNSSIYDIAKTKSQKKEKAVFIGTINEVKDLTTLFLNEIDSIINHGNNADMQAIKTLMLRLIKESQKNDPSDKYKSAGNLDKIIKKFNLV